MRRSVVILLLVLVAAVAGGGACISSMVSMPGTSFAGTPPQLNAEGQAVRAALTADVTHLAATLGERNVSNAPQALERAAAFVREQLVAAGYSVESQPYAVNGVTVENLIAEKRGTSRATELIVVGAHYDSAPGTPGADDNGSGVAVGLALARAFVKRSPARTVRFVFFTNEEPPWFETPDMGSEVYATAVRARREDVKAMLSLETMGYFSDAANSQHYPWPMSLLYPTTGNFIGFVADTRSRALVREAVRVFREEATVGSEGASVPASIEGVDWSDHGPFWRRGYRAFMVTDTAPFRNPHYHQATDLPARVDFERLTRVTQGLVRVVEDLANRDAVP